MSDKSGWYRIHRQIEDHWLYKKKPFCPVAAWNDLILCAHYGERTTQVDTGEGKIALKRGEDFKSAGHFMARWGWKSLSKVRRFWKKLEQDKMISQKSYKKGVHLIILEYDTYNPLRSVTDQRANSDRSVTDQSAISDRSRKNKTNKKEDKEDQEEKNLVSVVSAQPKHKKSFNSKYSERFEIFWKEFPKDRPGTKSKAYKIWQAYDLDNPEMKWAFEIIMNDVIVKKKEDSQWLEGFAVMPTTYLNGKLWETDVAQKTKNPYEGQLTKKGQDAMAWLKDV